METKINDENKSKQLKRKYLEKFNTGIPKTTKNTKISGITELKEEGRSDDVSKINTVISELIDRIDKPMRRLMFTEAEIE